MSYLWEKFKAFQSEISREQICNAKVFNRRDDGSHSLGDIWRPHENEVS